MDVFLPSAMLSRTSTTLHALESALERAHPHFDRETNSFFDLQEFRDANNPNEARHAPKLRKQTPKDLALLHIIRQHRDLLVGTYSKLDLIFHLGPSLQIWKKSITACSWTCVCGEEVSDSDSIPIVLARDHV